MDKKTYWKDGYQLIDNSGNVYTVEGKSAKFRQPGKNWDGSFVDEEEYDDNLKLIHRFQRGDKYDIVDVKMPGNYSSKNGMASLFQEKHGMILMDISTMSLL